ncbi:MULTISPECIES: hypothetical protein [unclassified Streptomyces]|uniref:hypothetical protein n=1 Tax=unclassified Streptomyces TaxID=2593676 RepID=UPI00203503E2|nr:MULTISPECIES: hypothetical protein [unclassified Streptomyces]
MPSMKVVRPEATWHQSINASVTAGHWGRRRPLRTQSTPASQVETSPQARVTGTTPSAAIA